VPYVSFFRNFNRLFVYSISLVFVDYPPFSPSCVAMDPAKRKEELDRKRAKLESLRAKTGAAKTEVGD